MATIILFAPLIGALLAGFGHRAIGDKGAQIVTTALLFLAALLSWVLFFGNYEEVETVSIMRWVSSGEMQVEWAIRLDRLTAIMLVVITTVSALVHLYSMGYMAHDEQYKDGESYRPRFFAYLSFFTFTMLVLVTADNLLQMFFGWEGVGVASYLLIGFYYRKPSANAAAMKAFIVNRVGDFGFLLGIFGIFYVTGSINFDVIFAKGPEMAAQSFNFIGYEVSVIETLTLLLFIGAMGKSAQLLLHTWLPDAMEGPTPVSALIHAATMVTAGVFLVSRMSPLFDYASGTLMIVTAVGATTAFFAATVGLVQNDIKRVIAYSTCSQLGYMFVAAGVGAYPVAMFHLFTHAFFKAMLFLGAGSVIHSMHHEQDMRNYGGLRKKIPLTFWAMMIGTLAITGVGIPLSGIGFAGFLSKDAIVESAFASGSGYAFWMLVIAAFMTSFYSWRLMFMTFYGTPRGDAHTHDHAHESPNVMIIPLAVLALGSVFAGMLWLDPFFGESMTEWFGPSVVSSNGFETIYKAHYAPTWVKVSPFIAMLLGFALSFTFYIWRTDLPARLANTFQPAYQFLLNKWYFDELYEAIFVRPAKWLGTFLWKKGDGAVVDGTINGLTMRLVPLLTRLAGRAQSGFLFTYAFAMILGVGAIITWFVLTGGAQ
ncbi:NADH-quinone oxidoreductase subunit L [Abyssibius alkaniclasticus]|uniref:NADH-quinone oxidoreductase subunit L n=1 Tax=Abyssibius alkaniclasticus TaxID=2881234 RepID=UPI0023649D99|nr:NADH-quinone oxidoreductase subunit L [Abyssibius alkaniclasticus]UPH70733.1 NADH-quinone oxidoreductase subunit L [Abyssibius alkaniclasticus]|tara:strand:+ start:1255 stop:3213 length:1959 start_codon:yes stop_codon:yes gene_type:complete